MANPSPWSSITGTWAGYPTNTWDTIPTVSVADSWGTSWTDYASIADSWGTSWVTRAVISDSWGTSWTVKSVISDGWQTSWNIVGRVSDTWQTSWTTNAYISDSWGTTWTTRFAISDTWQTLWNIAGVLQTVSDTWQTSWAVKAIISDTWQTSWNTIAVVADTWQTSWVTKGIIADSWQTSWDTRTIVGPDTWQTSWNIKGIVSDSWQTSWNTSGTISDSWSTSWVVKGIVSDSWQTLWNISLAGAPVSDSWQTSWITRVSWDSLASTTWTFQAGYTWDTVTPGLAVYKGYQVIWNTTAYVSDTWQTLWSITVPISSVQWRTLWNITLVSEEFRWGTKWNLKSDRGIWTPTDDLKDRGYKWGELTGRTWGDLLPYLWDDISYRWNPTDDRVPIWTPDAESLIADATFENDINGWLLWPGDEAAGTAMNWNSTEKAIRVTIGSGGAYAEAYIIQEMTPVNSPLHYRFKARASHDFPAFIQAANGTPDVSEGNWIGFNVTTEWKWFELQPSPGQQRPFFNILWIGLQNFEAVGSWVEFDEIKVLQKGWTPTVDIKDRGYTWNELTGTWNSWASSLWNDVTYSWIFDDEVIDIWTPARAS